MEPNNKSAARRTGTEARIRARRGEIKGSNTGIATGVYCNLVVLPQEYASDFKQLCLRNPVPLPLLEQTKPGVRNSALATDSDISTDIPRYNIYQDGTLLRKGIEDTTSEWSDNHVGFLIGCSFSLEIALAAAGLEPRNMTEGKPPPVFNTTVRMNPSGVFKDSHMVVSMRWYHPKDIDKVRAITRQFSRQHGEPVGWGWDYAEYIGAKEKLGSCSVDFGEWSEPEPGQIPVFFGCGVTGEVAVRDANLPGVIITHHPGFMFVTDVTAEDIENYTTAP